MGSHEPKFDQLIEELRSGSEEAAQTLYNQYGGHVRRAVRRRLHAMMRARYDSQDFTQAVWASFFTDLPHLSEMEDPKQLVKFLIRVAHGKVIDACRRRMMGKQDNVNRELSLDEPGLFRESELGSSQPTPSEYAMANEQWSQLLHGQRPIDVEIARLRASGATTKQTADALGIDTSTVRRVIRKLAREVEPPC